MGADHLTGMIGGVDVRGPDGSRMARCTTPEASEVQRTLTGFVQGKGRTVTMEVSSHALALHRVDGTIFRVAVFTNLGPDHLDFHSSMEAYFDTKAKLFGPERCRVTAIGVDDEYGRRQELQSFFDTMHTVGDELPPSYNVAPTQPVRVILERTPHEEPDADSEPQRQLRTVRWGLLPAWSRIGRWRPS